MIVRKYVKGNINWPREIKIAQRLVKRFNSFDFWDNLKELVSPPPSLAWFLKPEGKAFILKEYEPTKSTPVRVLSTIDNVKLFR